MAIKCTDDSVRSWLHVDILFLLVWPVFIDNDIALGRTLKNGVKKFRELDLGNVSLGFFKFNGLHCPLHHWNISTKYSPKLSMDILYCASRSGWRLPCLQQCNTVRGPRLVYAFCSHAIPCIIVFTPRHAAPSLQEYIHRHPFSLMASLSCNVSIYVSYRSQLPFPAVSLAHTYSHTFDCCLSHE
jgi:hypothetical protein